MASRGDAELCPWPLWSELHSQPCDDWLCACKMDWSFTKMLFELVGSDWICSCFFCDTHWQHRGRSILKYIFYFIFYFYLTMFIYHFASNNQQIKGLLDKVCNMLYKYSLSETFIRFVLLKCRVFTLSLPSLKYPMHVWFWKKSMCECYLKAIFC